MYKLLTICAAVALLGVSSIINADQAAEKKIEPLRELALELIDGLDRSRGKLENCRKMGTALPFGDKLCRKRKKSRIALRPFRQEDIPFAKKVANELNDKFLTYLIGQGEGRYDFVARAELPALTDAPIRQS